LPAYLANGMPVILGKIKCLDFLKIPVDFGKKLKGKEIFGTHKTYFGFIVGIFAAILVALLLNSGGLIEYSWLNGLLLGFGALFGDLIKSFFKRRFSIKSGEFFFPFDQVDFILGAWLIESIFYPIGWQILLMALIITPLIHLIANVIGYMLGLKKVWW